MLQCIPRPAAVALLADPHSFCAGSCATLARPRGRSGEKQRSKLKTRNLQARHDAASQQLVAEAAAARAKLKMLQRLYGELARHKIAATAAAAAAAANVASAVQNG